MDNPELDGIFYSAILVRVRNSFTFSNLLVYSMASCLGKMRWICVRKLMQSSVEDADNIVQP
jgi:hypothetical protein